jgi:TP901 family phage tail tape measure protein
MSANERLGIQLDVTTTGQDSFSKLQSELANLQKTFEKLNSLSNGTKTTFEDLAKSLKSDSVNGYAKAFQGMADAVKASTKDISESVAVQTRTLQESFGKLNKVVAKPQIDTSGIQQTNTAITSIHATLTDVTKRLAEFYAVRSGIFAIASEFRSAGKSLTGFNQEMHETAAIANASTEQLNRMSEAALSIAKNSKFSAQEVMASFKTLAQAGVSASDLPDVGRTVDFFATGSGSSPDQAAKVLTTAMNVWEVEAQKAGRISNLMTAALNSSKLEVGDLSTAFNYSANTAKIFEKSMEDTVGAIAVLSNQGQQASTIGTGISNLLTKLAAPSDKFRELLKEFGVGLDEIAPRTHTFAEIIARIEKAAIPAERIIGALEIRTGRTLVTALSAGSEKFELMTQRITNSNAAAVAYNESMKGVEAQINILRGEAVETLDTSLKGLGVSFTDLRENLQNIVVGLRSAEGQFLTFTTVLTTGLIALSRIAAANPVLTGLGVVATATAFAIGKLGETNRETAHTIEETTKKSAEQSAEYQRKSQALYDVLGLVDKNKTTEKGYLEVQGESQKKLRAIMNDFPELFKGLDLKKLKYTELTEVIRKYNAERSKELKQDVNSANYAAENINDLKAQLKASQLTESNNDSNNNLFNFQQFTTHNLQQQLKEAEEAYSKMLSANLTHRNDIEVYLDAMGTKRVRTVEAPAEKPHGKATIVPEKVKHHGATPEEKAEDTIRRLTEDQKAIADKLTYEKARIDRETAELQLKDKTLTAREYQEKELNAVKLLDQEYADKQQKERTKAFTSLAKTLGGSYTMADDKHPSGLVTYSKRFNADQVASLIDQTNRNLNTQSGVVDAAAKKKELERIRQMKPAETYTLNSGMIERAADKELTARTQALKIAEKQVSTGQELQVLQVAETQAQIDNANKKAKAYQTDLDTLGERNALDKDQLATYDSISDKLEAINLKQKELSRQLTEQTAGNFDHMLSGLRQSFAEFTNEAKFYTSAGSGLASATTNGLTNAISGSLGTIINPNSEAIAQLESDIADKEQQKRQLESDISSIMSNTNKTPQEIQSLNQKKTALDGINKSLDNQKRVLAEQTNAWSAFRKGMAGFAKGIVDEMQRIIAQMIAMKIIGSMIGLFSNSTPDISAATTANVNYGMPLGDGNYSGALKIDPAYRAEGGAIGNSILPPDLQKQMAKFAKGTDTVPAMLSVGEFVIKKPAVDRIGVAALQKLNDMQYYSDGGLVGGGKSKGTAATESREMTLIINNIADPSSIPPSPLNATEVINIVGFDISKHGVLRRTIKEAVNS